jgi:menaquinone-dependent protoporphyrinogen IX oxidase
MKRVCILYDTVSGSTAEIAEMLKDELSLRSCSVTLMSIAKKCVLDDFDIVIIGSPLRFGGFTSGMRKFIRKNKNQLKAKPLFVYITLLYLTRIDNNSPFEMPCYIDPSLEVRSFVKNEASSMDMSHSLAYYYNKLGHHLQGIHPQGIAFLNGRLIIEKLPLLTRLFMKIVIRLTTKEKEGDFINPGAVKEWAMEISSLLMR